MAVILQATMHANCWTDPVCFGLPQVEIACVFNFATPPTVQQLEECERLFNRLAREAQQYASALESR